MEPLLKSDIFFVISSIAVIILAILLGILIIYLIRLFRDVGHITHKAKEETDLISGDIDDLRSKTREQGFKWSLFLAFFKKLFRRKKK